VAKITAFRFLVLVYLSREYHVFTQFNQLSF
jgi:hypothetical protein